MKLLLNITCCQGTMSTGIERFALHIARELSRIDPDVVIVAPTGLPGISPVATSRLLQAASTYLNSFEYLVRALWDQTLLRAFVTLHSPDVVFFPIQDGMLFPPVQQIVTVHDLHYLHFDGTVAECRRELPTHRRFFYRVKMPHILHRSAAIIVVSEATKNDLIQTFGISPDKVQVVYNGYDPCRFHELIDSFPVLERLGLGGKRYFLFVGSILRHKNIVRLVQAFARQDTSMLLVIAGVCKDADYLEEIMNASACLGVDRVRYLKYVTDDDLPSLYRGASAFILPSLHEGFGVPIIEAMACGTPVITSNCSAMPEVAGDAALLVDPYSVENIAAAMRDLLENPFHAEVLRKAGLERVKLFSWSYSAKKLYDLCLAVNNN